MHHDVTEAFRNYDQFLKSLLTTQITDFKNIAYNIHECLSLLSTTPIPPLICASYIRKHRY